MAKTLLIVSLALMLFTAGVGFMTKTKIDLLNTDLKGRRDEVTGLNGTVKKQSGEIAKGKEELAVANKNIEDQKGQLQVAANDLSAAKGESEKAKAAQTEAETALAASKTELDKAKEDLAKMDKVGIPPEQVAKLKEDYEKAKTAMAEAQQVADTLKTRAHEYETKNASLTAEVERYHKIIQKPGITGRVVAVNSGWNFVVIDVGDKRGATLGAQLIVSRSGQTVGKLKVTSVEPSSCIADVVPGSVPRGSTVQPGDTVIFAGRQDMSPAPVEGGAGTPPSAPGTGAPNGISSLTPPPTL